MDWLNNFIIPIIEVVIIGGVFLTIAFFIGRAIWNAWSKSLKFIWKYKILRRKYPEQQLIFIMDCIDKKIGFYGAKKLLYINMKSQKEINETLFIYDQVVKEMVRENLIQIKSLQKEKKLNGM